MERLFQNRKITNLRQSAKIHLPEESLQMPSGLLSGLFHRLLPASEVALQQVDDSYENAGLEWSEGIGSPG